MMIGTRDTVMDAARAMVQAHGYNALSFREIGKVVGIKSSSIHHHFPTKGDLGAALAHRYTEDGRVYLNELLETSQDLDALIPTYIKIFRSALENDNRMCLCGIMAAERDDLPQEVRVEVDRFTDVNVAWLTRVLKLRHPKTGEAQIERQALAAFAAISGAQLVARGRGDIALFDQAVATYSELGLLS